MLDAKTGLRERKKRRTRLALAEAALRLFRDQGYEQTTVAQIAAAADVSTRTFFGYFRSKEDVLFGDTDDRMRLLREAIAQAPPGTSATDVARAVLARGLDAKAGLFGPESATRIRLVLSTPELRAKALERILAAHHDIATWLRDSHRHAPDSTLPDTVAGALLGGLISTTLAVLHRNAPTETLHAELVRAIDLLDRIVDPRQEVLAD